ncbi:MAG: DUF3604 domain-containing protein, partial [Pseudomonadota bacterium]
MGPRSLAPLAFLFSSFLTGIAPVAVAGTCTPESDEKELLWGDLHVHTAYSLDAYAFGALATPEAAYAFARGEPLTLASGEVAKIERPLDFTAVTDHAETFDLMWACTDPGESDDPYCQSLRENREALNSRNIFNDFLLPIVSLTPPSFPGVCATVDCAAARMSQWQRHQAAANAANEPCEFTALIGYEWTASPGGRHWHRNVIYRSEQVPDQAFDYVRFPEVGLLWQQLDKNCRTEDGCDVITIPHNINWADGGTFDLTTEPPDITALRRQYERLAEVHQEKGSSECLPASREETAGDCRFELVTENAAKHRMSGPVEDENAAWEQARQSYYRTLLGAGLAHPENPFQLGAIGSTDTHFGTPGMVAEASFFGGIALLFASPEARLSRTDFNGGGLVAVWAEENTRASIFDALKRREAYATSGPRIGLRFGTEAYCADEDTAAGIAMGGTLPDRSSPEFHILVARDQAPLDRLEIVKGTMVEGGELKESVRTIATFNNDTTSQCITWQDPTFDPSAPAYWYLRVLETPTPRWSKRLCAELDQCEAYPDANVMIQERAWSSPIW